MPTIIDYYRELQPGAPLLLAPTGGHNIVLEFNEDRQCLQFWADAVLETIRTNYSDPGLVREALADLSLIQMPEVQRALRSYLIEPQPLWPETKFKFDVLAYYSGTLLLRTEADHALQ